MENKALHEINDLRMAITIQIDILRELIKILLSDLKDKELKDALKELSKEIKKIKEPRKR